MKMASWLAGWPASASFNGQLASWRGVAKLAAASQPYSWLALQLALA